MSPIPSKLKTTPDAITSHRNRCIYPVRAPQIFPPLIVQEAPLQENEQLRKQLQVLQAAGTEKLQRRIEELLNHMDTITKEPAQTAALATPPLEMTQQPFKVQTQTDIGRLEKLF